jgi:branched-chain amino acid transport system ATP-binding protein
MTLEAINLKKSFGGLRAVDDVSFAASAGELTCITGPNGAGKTTLFNLLTGFCTADEGRVLLDGRDITDLSPAARARLGTARTFQNIRLLDEISALDNLVTAMHGELNGTIADTLLPTLRRKRKLKHAREYAHEQLNKLGLDAFSDMPAGKMPYGARKSLEIARCLCMRPRLMLLDEPASGLNTQEAFELGEIIRTIDKSEIIIVVIEHNMALVRQIADRVIHIDSGHLKYALERDEWIRQTAPVNAKGGKQ